MNKKFALIIAIVFIIASISVVQPALGKMVIKNRMIGSTASTSIIKLLNKGNYTTPLHDDKGILGNVTVWIDSGYIFVKYITVKGFMINQTYLQIADNFQDIPQYHGNLLPEQFEYQTKHNPSVKEYTYKIKDEDKKNTNLYIAANAIVSLKIYTGGLEYVEEHLPDEAIVKAVHATSIPPYNQSYFKTILTGDTFIDGEYKGWCIDLDSSMIDNHVFTANVYSSYETIPDGLIEKPWNLDLVNYIINQDYVGKQSQCDGFYTYGDVQRAIWELLEDQQTDTYYLGPWQQCKVDEILADANANGEGYYPCCNNPCQTYKVAIILEPVNKTDGQVSIIEYIIPCIVIEYDHHSVWGKGLIFPGSDSEGEFFIYFKILYGKINL